MIEPSAFRSFRRADEVNATPSTTASRHRDAIFGRINALLLPAYFADQSRLPGFLGTMKTIAFNRRTSELVNTSIANDDLSTGLGKLSMRTLIVHGREDPLDPEMAGKTRDAIPGARLVVLENCGHFAWIEAPGALHAALESFVDGSIGH